MSGNNYIDFANVKSNSMPSLVKATMFYEWLILIIKSCLANLSGS